MKQTFNRRLVSLLLVLMMLLVGNAAVAENSAENWVPERNITVIVPFGAGDGLDLTSRALFEYCDFPVKTII